MQIKVYYIFSLLIFCLLGLDLQLNAQSNPNEYLTRCRSFLKEGNCEKAQVFYDIYTELTNKKDILLEQQLKECTNKFPETKPITVNGVTFNMIMVKGDTFTMGCADCSDVEKPAHQVTLSDYYIGETEVTQGLWQAVMGKNPSYFSKGNNYPVEQVSWNDCQEFIKKLNSLTGMTFRLPTEAEWEYAARGGQKSKGYKYAGNNDLKSVAWYGGNSGGTTHPVGTKQANELGLYDMSGNVYEWCQDWDSSYSSISQTNPTGPSSGSYRVLRGGSWISVQRSCRLSYRNYNSPDYRLNGGLRLVLVP